MRQNITRKVLVTGGAGFIGSELTLQLTGKFQVVVVDNLVNGKRENVVPEAELVVADIRDGGRMTELMNGVETVFHLACLGVRHSIHSPLENHDVNATATLTLLQSAQKAGVKRFVHVSTSEVYGTAKTVPMSEEHPAFPQTVYGAAKLAGECYSRAYFDTYGFETMVIRPFNAYGPRSHHEGDCGEVIPKFMLRSMAGEPMIIFGDGTQTRDFTYVSDIAAGIIGAGFCDDAVGQTINLGQGNEITINDLAKAVGGAGGVVHDEPRPGDVLRLYADTRKAQRLFDYKPNVSLEEGLGLLRKWYADKDPEQLLKEERVHNWQKA